MKRKMDPVVLDASTASNASAKLQGRFILRDTMGPTGSESSLEAAGVNLKDSNGSSSSSSIKELSATDEKGLNRSFRAIQMSKFLPVPSRPDQGTLVEEDISDGHNDESSDRGLKTEPIQILNVNEDRGTPESTASSHSSQRVIIGKNGSRTTFSPAVLQDKSDLAKTTRGQLRLYEQEQRNQQAPNHVDLPEQTHVKTPYPETGEPFDNAPQVQTHVKTPYPETGEPFDNAPQVNYIITDNRRASSCCQWGFIFRCSFLALFVVIVVTGMALVIHFNKDDGPSGQRGKVIPDKEEAESSECPLVEIKFKDQIVFNCTFKDDTREKLKDATRLTINPPSYFNNGTNIAVGILSSATEGRDKRSDEIANGTEARDQNDVWQIILADRQSTLTVSGPTAKCSSSGNYTLVFEDSSNKVLHNVTLTIAIISEVSKVNVTLSQENTTEGEKQFIIGCSTNSGCEQSFVDFFAEINKEETYIKGVDFRCILEYKDSSGYSVLCEGIIPDFLMEQFEKITCRPSSKLLDDKEEKEIKKLEEEVELPDCDIAKNCGYSCEDLSEYYFIVDIDRCDIFHQCHHGEVYSAFCPPGTFFIPEKCSCDHSDNANWCRRDGYNHRKNETWCDASIQQGI